MTEQPPEPATSPSPPYPTPAEGRVSLALPVLVPRCMQVMFLGAMWTVQGTSSSGGVLVDRGGCKLATGP